MFLSSTVSCPEETAIENIIPDSLDWIGKKIEKLVVSITYNFIKNRFSMTGFTRFTLLELFCSKISLDGSSTKFWKTCQLIYYYFVTFLFLEIEVFLQFIYLNKKKIFEKGLQFHENLTNGFREDFLEF